VYNENVIPFKLELQQKGILETNKNCVSDFEK
jgi:hypothetical protein